MQCEPARSVHTGESALSCNRRRCLNRRKPHIDCRCMVGFFCYMVAVFVRTAPQWRMLVVHLRFGASSAAFAVQRHLIEMVEMQMLALAALAVSLVLTMDALGEAALSAVFSDIERGLKAYPAALASDKSCEIAADCVFPLICVNKTCVRKNRLPGQTCERHTDCYRGVLCLDGLCAGKTCRSDSDCSSNQRCVRGVARRGRAVGSWCDGTAQEGEKCTSSIDCALNNQCVAGKCSCRLRKRRKRKHGCISRKCSVDAGKQKNCDDDSDCASGSTCVKGQGCISCGTMTTQRTHIVGVLVVLGVTFLAMVCVCGACVHNRTSLGAFLFAARVSRTIDVEKSTPGRALEQI